MDYITFKHSFNAGDLITVLPGIKHICEKNNKKAIVYQRLNLIADYGHNDMHPVTSNGRMVCMDDKMFDMLRPLILKQEYIARFEVWSGQDVDFDFDKTRHNAQMPLPGGDIHKWPSLIFPQLECELGQTWIDVPPNNEIVYNELNNLVCINLTERYRNPYVSYHFLREYKSRCMFLGTHDEWASFCKKWTLYGLSYANVNDFLHLAQIIKGCKFFLGNQSFCWHLADAMKVPRILEVCAQYPNTFPTGIDGYSFITQEALEFRFHKLLNEGDARDKI